MGEFGRHMSTVRTVVDLYANDRTDEMSDLMWALPAQEIVNLAVALVSVLDLTLNVIDGANKMGGLRLTARETLAFVLAGFETEMRRGPSERSEQR